MKDVPDFLDGDQEPQTVLICCSPPYFSFGKGLRLINSLRYQCKTGNLRKAYRQREEGKREGVSTSHKELTLLAS